MPTEFENRLYELYLDYFRHAEDNRRWNIERDIPWDQINPNMSEKVAFILEGFTAVEMYLPDYTSKSLQMVRASRGRAWFQANWGYEESKHSMVFEEWLVRSGKRTLKGVREYADTLLGKEWDLPIETPQQMIVYTMFQELATQLNYRKLRLLAKEEGDPALDTALHFVGRDEAAHHKFFKDGVKLLLEYERDKTLEDIQHVAGEFKMPALTLIPDWQTYEDAIYGAGIFSPKIYLKEVLLPTLKSIGVTRAELKAMKRGTGLDISVPENENDGRDGVPSLVEQGTANPVA
ncbi:MAG: hypothetical protein EXR50_05925 [Dehalococcoidia bacterium]|nr:hypothetical protein [Dehalococcoidia bacterium]